MKWMRVLRHARYAVALQGLLIAALQLPGSLTGQSRETSTLIVQVTNARSSKGRIAIALFQEASGFPGDSSKALRLQRAVIDPAKLSSQFVFEGIPRGVYAVSVFHDENMNGKLDKNFMGVPREGYGFSNNPKKRMGPPSFEEAKFTLDQPEQSVVIGLTY